jgi:hypothetical protein
MATPEPEPTPPEIVSRSFVICWIEPPEPEKDTEVKYPVLRICPVYAL